MTEKLTNFWASPSFRTTTQAATGAVGRVALRLILPMLLMAMLAGLSGQHHAFAQEAAGNPAEPGPAAAVGNAPDTAAPVSTVTTGDTAWMLMSAALVLLMTPGLALFYGGLVRGKNMLNTMLMSFGAMALMGVLWIFIGYSFAFGDGGAANKLFGGFQYAFFDNMPFDAAAPAAEAIPHLLFAIFQGMFFIITPALISGSLVERMKFSTYMVFIGIWGVLVYAPVAHWIWGGGWIAQVFENRGGVLDFAGGAVVHVNAGFAALALTLVLGTRNGYNKRPMLPHNLPLCLLGAGLLWFGWFGFNGGSALASSSTASLAFVNTQLGASAAMLVWMLIEQITRKEMTALGAATGAVAGLVGITPACGFVTPMGAIFVGGITAVVCYISAQLRAKGPVDDSLDSFAVHGVGGFTGAVLTGIFASAAVGVKGGGLLAGNVNLFINQILATSAVALYSFVVAYILALVLKAVMGLRVSDENEERGLDVAEHGEEAYASS